MRRCYPLLFLLAMVCFPLYIRAQAWSGILSPSRAIDWSNAGVPGGIPTSSWTKCGSTIPAYSGTASTINNAIAACGSNQYVQLAAGTFKLSSGITWGSSGKSNVALRGMGADQTFLVFTGGDNCLGFSADVCIASSDTNYGGGPSNSASWTAGYSEGATGITLSNVTNLHVGWPLILDQVDDSADNGNLYVCQSSSTNPPCSLEGNNNMQRPNRDQVQIVQVVSCGTASTFGQACNGTNVTVSPGLYMPNWRSSQSPGAWWATTPVFHNGIENLSIDNTNSSGNGGVEILNCDACWVSGIRSIDSGRAHVELGLDAHDTVQNNYFYATQNSTSESYGISSFTASDDLYSNNIAQYVASPFMINGACSGCVLSYNFAINDYYAGSAGWVMPTTMQHTGGIAMLLYEGNIGGVFDADPFHGSHDFVTYFRNYLSGNQPVCYNGSPNQFSTCTNDQTPIVLNSYSRYYNIIGNVLGQSGVQTGYTTGAQPIYSIGQGDTEGGVTVPNDPLVAATLMRWGNYDTVNSSAQWNSSEVPSTISLYGNTVPSSNALPASFYLSARPNWWPSSKPFPPIGPDVTGGNVAGVGGHAYTIPAEDCYLNFMKGPANGTGGVLSFNASSCYGQADPAPDAPTNLTATPH